MHKVHGTKICLYLNGLLDGQEKQGTVDCDRSLGNKKVDEKELEEVGEAPPSRYDYGILLDYDPSGAISRNLLEYFQTILLLTNRIATDTRTFYSEPSR